jgi:hypothetical protein
MSETGPPYPPVKPGSNAIGSFQVGVSPIGTIPPFDWWDTVISQYANSPIMTAIIGTFAEALDQTENFDNFYDRIMNVLSAEGYGLDVWGRIVGVSRVLYIPEGGPFLGFQQADDPTNIQGWDQGIWYAGAGLTQNYSLSDPAYLLLILAKAALNITDCGIPGINTILLALFPNRGDCYVVDNLDLTFTYMFAFALTPVEQAIVQQSGVLPRPAGVSYTASFP